MAASELCSPSPSRRFTARFGWAEPTAGHMTLLERLFFISKHNCLRFLLMQRQHNRHLSVTFPSAGYSALVGPDSSLCSVGAPPPGCRLSVSYSLISRSRSSLRGLAPCARGVWGQLVLLSRRTTQPGRNARTPERDEAAAAPADEGACAKWTILRARTCISTGMNREAPGTPVRQKLFPVFLPTAALKPFSGQRSSPTGAPADG